MADKKIEVKSEEVKAEVVEVKKNEGSEIAQAISEGLKNVGDKNFKVSVDESVNPMFTVVKNDEGEYMLRDNTDGHLSKVQMQSLEEKEASIQGQKVTEL